MFIANWGRACWNPPANNAWLMNCGGTELPFQLQYPQPLKYKDIRLDCGYRIDILVENKLILELKSVEEIKGIHEAQLLTYMKLAGVKIGLLINFNNTKLKDGIKRFVL